MDFLFQINTIQSVTNPNQVVYLAAHQDYSDHYVFEEFLDNKIPSEKKCGEYILNILLAGNRGHFGCFEHPQIVVSCGYFPHSTMQQLRTHRVGISFDVQSFRYTSNAIYNLGKNVENSNYNFALLLEEVEKVFYLRPIGTYTARDGKKYDYTQADRSQDIKYCLNAAWYYAKRLDQQFSEEHARGLLPFDLRQHFVVSLNARSLMHLLDLRAKADAQLECQWFCDLLFAQFELWMPELAQWYKYNRWKKARLSP